MLLIVPNLTIYTHPYVKLISAHIRETRAAVLITGSFVALWTWNVVKIALSTTRDQQEALFSQSHNARKQKRRHDIERLPLSQQGIDKRFPRILEPNQGRRHKRRRPLIRTRQWHMMRRRPNRRRPHMAPQAYPSSQIRRKRPRRMRRRLPDGPCMHMVSKIRRGIRQSLRSRSQKERGGPSPALNHTLDVRSADLCVLEYLRHPGKVHRGEAEE